MWEKRKKVLSVFLVFALVVSFSLMTAVPAAAQTTINVPADYLTIQAAINAASPGDTIIVGGGEYPEKLVINKADLTLQGDGAYPQIKPTLINSSKYDTVIKVLANDVTIRGLDISNANGIVDQTYWGHIEHHGIWDNSWEVGPSGLTVDDCKFHDIEHGVRSYGNNFTVTNSEFYHLGRTGVYASGGGASPLSMTVQNNWFHDFTPSWKENHAVHIKYDVRVGEISYNYMSGMRIGVAYYYGGPKPGFGQVIIKHNTMDLDYDLDGGTKDMTMGYATWGTIANADNIIIQDNIFTSAQWYGIYQEGGSIAGSVRVDNNLFYNNYWYYWPDYQLSLQWFGDDTKAQAGWTGGAGGFTFENNITAQDPLFALTGTSPEEQWALTSGSPAYHAASDGTTIGAWQGELPSAKSVQEQAFEELNNIYPTGDKKVDEKLDKAIEHLEKALDGDLWEDDTHLELKHGAKVFNEGKKTIKELMHLIAKKDATQDMKDACQDIIGKLIEADALLANTAYEEAKAYAGDPKVDKELEKCDKEFAKANKELAKGHFDKAIKHYKNAWKHAQKALGKAPQDDEEGED